MMKPDDAAHMIMQRLDQLTAEAGAGLGGQIRRRVDPAEILMSAVGSFFRKKELPDDENHFWALLHGYIENKRLEYLRRMLTQSRDPSRERALDAGGDVEDRRSTGEEEREIEILLRALERAIARLPERERIVILMTLEGVRQVDIANEFDLSTRQVRRYHAAALERLKTWLAEEHGDE